MRNGVDIAVNIDVEFLHPHANFFHILRFGAVQRDGLNVDQVHGEELLTKLRQHRFSGTRRRGVVPTVNEDAAAEAVII